LAESRIVVVPPEFNRLELKGRFLDQLGRIARHPADGKTADEDQVADAFGTPCRIGERRGSADRGAEQGETADIACVHHRIEIVKAPVEREI
jgi:hypothetical protein